MAVAEKTLRSFEYPPESRPGVFLDWLGACHYATKVRRTHGTGSLEHRAACMVAKRARLDVVALRKRKR